jgi:hypothetical protein
VGDALHIRQFLGVDRFSAGGRGQRIQLPPRLGSQPLLVAGRKGYRVDHHPALLRGSQQLFRFHVADVVHAVRHQHQNVLFPVGLFQPVDRFIQGIADGRVAAHRCS